MSPIAQTPSREVRSRPSTLIRPRSSRSMPASSSPSPSTSGAAAGGDAPGSRTPRVSPLNETFTPTCRGLGALDLRAGLDPHVLLLDLPRARPGDVLVLERQDLVERLEQQHLGAEPAERRGDLRARRARADHAQPRRLLVRAATCPAVSRIRPPNCRSSSGLATEPQPGSTALGLDLGPVELTADLHVAVVGQRAEALDQVDLVLLEQPRDAAGERLDHLVAVLRGAASSRPTRPSPRSRSRPRAPPRSSPRPRAGSPSPGCRPRSGSARRCCPSRPRRSSCRAARPGSRRRSRPGPSRSRCSRTCSPAWRPRA